MYHDYRVFKSKHRETEPGEPAGRDPAVRGGKGLSDRFMGGRDRKRKDCPQEKETRAAAQKNGQGRHIDRDGDLPSEPLADRDNGHHGRMSRQTDQHLHHEGTLYLRQFHQQQGTVLRFRPGRRDRKESHFHAYEGGAGAEEGGGRAAGPSAR